MKHTLLSSLFLIFALAISAQSRPEHLYIIGTLNEDGSYDVYGREFTTDDNNVYVCNEVRIYKQSAAAIRPDIYIVEKSPYEKPPTGGTVVSYTVVDNDPASTLTEGMFEGYVGRKSASALSLLVIPETGLYNFKLDFTGIDNLSGCKPMLTLTEVKDGPITSVENLAADNSPAIYYNLQGCRVENPAGGTFIELKNGRAKKVFIP